MESCVFAMCGYVGACSYQAVLRTYRRQLQLCRGGPWRQPCPRSLRLWSR